MEKILTTKQMSFCEKRSDELGVSLAELMDNAGEKLARHILSSCEKQMSKEVVILVGKGNNGGDGLVSANFLYNFGVKPIVVLCCGKPATDLSKKAFDRLHKEIEVVSCDNAYDKIAECDVLCDCIFGTGFHGKLRESILPVFDACEKCSGIKIACDIPSGANARNGMCDKRAFKADFTVTFHRKKLGMLMSPAKFYCGNIIVEDIKIPPECENELDNNLQFCDNDFVKNNLPYRTPYGHKGTFGKTVLVCGSKSYIGASAMSSLGAMRTGVGLCNLCTTEFVISALAGKIPECTFSQMECDNDGFITSKNVQKILSLSQKSQSLLIGCGLGNTAETQKLVAELVEKCDENCTLIIDADGINSLCPNIDILYKKRTQIILTPHPAELARLCDTSVSDIAENRFEYACELAQKYNVSVLTKGAETIFTDGKKSTVISVGNTALSKGGSGDMLAGIVASLSAQKCSYPAVTASMILGQTAEMLSEKYSERGIIATDILNAIPEFLKIAEG